MIINMVENPFFTISNDYLFKAIMTDAKIRKYIFKVCFDKEINIKKISNVRITERK